jgi:hypothetical protein
MTFRTKSLLLLVMIAAVIVVAKMRQTDSLSAEKYAGISNKELQERALRLVKNLRDLVYSYNKKDKDLMVEYQADYLATRTTERTAVARQFRTKSEEVVRSFVRDYQAKFLADAVSLREELYKRLPKQMHRARGSDVYKNPPNVLAIEEIADHLELLAKSLPDK